MGQIVVFEADSIPKGMSPIMEFFEFDVWTLGALLDEYLQSWCDMNPDILRESANWYKIDVKNGNELFDY